MMGNLIIRVDASAEMGTGHLMRCLALAQAWKDTGGKVTFITACQSSELLQRPREEDFELHVLSHPYPDAGDWEQVEDILGAHPSAWVVLDGYHFDEAYQQRVKGAEHQLLVIDDMAHLKHYYADIVLNQNLGAEEYHYSCEPYTKLLVGSRYVLLRREFLAWRSWKREIPKVAQRVLVTLGGGDFNNPTLNVIQALQRVDVSGLETIVVIGASNSYTSALEAAIRQSQIPIRLIRDAKNMPELIAWADVAVSAAGTTIWELLFFGTPSLVLISATNQRYVAEQIGSEGIGESLGSVETLSVDTLAETIARLLRDQVLRAKMSKRGKKLVDGIGVTRIISEIHREMLPP